MNISERTADAYNDLIRRGYGMKDAVVELSARYDLTASAIRSRLRRAGVLPKCGQRRQSVHPRLIGFIPGDEITARRVDRDPCPRCGTRRDKGCSHRPVEHLSNVVFA